MCVPQTAQLVVFWIACDMRLPTLTAILLQASSVDPAQLQYREQYMSIAATSGMDEEQARARVHEVIRMLEPTFDIPSTAEGIEMLTHIRCQDDLAQVLTWLGPAVQQTAMQANGRKVPGWSTPAPPSAKAAADAWALVRSESYLFLRLNLKYSRRCQRPSIILVHFPS
jgi:hypothetical protein